MAKRIALVIVAVVLFTIAYIFPARAFESTSTDFFIRGDVGYAGGDVTSTDFQLFSNGQLDAMSTITSTDFEIIPGVIRTIFQPVKPIYTQIHYHWRNDNGSETSATSATGGIEDTPLTGLPQNTSIRVRMEITNDGGTIFSYSAQSFQLQYGQLSTTCSAISSWTAVGGTGAVWGMYNSSNLTDGQNTTDIATSTGGVADGNHTFIVANAGVKTTTSTVAAISVPSDSFIETEFDVDALSSSTPGDTYCFRLTNAGSASNFTYSQYPEATLSVPPINPVTNASGTAATSQVTLTWTNPTSTYFADTVVLRATSTILAMPATGTTYTVGQAIGSSTVACVVASSTSGCTDTGLTNGTQYYYDIFTKDSFGNYSTGVTPTGSPFTPGSSQSITLTLNTSTVNLPGLAPGISVTATTTATVSVTGASSGYTISIQRNSATSTIASGTIAFPDYTSWGPSGSTCASGQGNGTTTPGSTFSFRVASSGTTGNYCSFWWGASDVGGTAIYAGVPTTSQIIVNSTSSASQNGTTTVTILYSANAPTSQKATSYSGGVTITAIANP